MQAKLVYCQDAMCGWCYGFSPVIEKLADEFSDRLAIDVMAGGMVTGERVGQVVGRVEHIIEAVGRIEEMAGVRFGEGFLKNLRQPGLSRWRPDSEPPAIATAIFKELLPERILEFAADLNSANHRDGIDLSDLDNYRPLVEKFGLDGGSFLSKMMDGDYVERAHYDFFLCRQLQVTGFPTLFLQTDSLHFYLLSRGWSDFGSVKKRLENALGEWAAMSN